MTLCTLCQPLGNWLVPDLDVNRTRYVYNEYDHHTSWSNLQSSANQGCEFCQLVIHYFSYRGAYEGWYEHDIVSYLNNESNVQSWVSQIAAKQEDGDSTAIVIYKGMTDYGEPKLLFYCNGIGSGDRGVSLYVAHGDPSAYPLTRLRVQEHVDSEPLSEHTIKNIKAWASQCAHKHDACGLLNTKFVPMRVIDVAKEGMNPFLIETNWDMKYSKYACLSHCWGKTKHVLTKLDNLEHFKAGIEYSALSKTFRDAIQLARHLDIRYLWIDSLCIVQDSAKDWEINAADMGTIYLNSYLTIAAMDAVDGSQGFLHQRQPPCALPYRSNHPEYGIIEGDVWVNSWYPDLADAVGECPMSTRAWVTQERFLPSRILHCGTYRFMWECQTQEEVEYGSNSRDLQKDRVKSDWTSAARFAKILSRNLESREELNTLYSVWHLLVSEYSQRNLTYIKDRLPAISGLAKYFQQAAGDKYYAGLWLHDLPHALCWEPNIPWRRPDIYIAPSWSWASFASGVSYPLPIKECVTYLEDVEFSATPVSKMNPFGMISNGSLRCSGLIRKTSIVYQPEGLTKVFTYEGELLGTTELEVAYDLKFGSSWCLLVSERENYKPNRVLSTNSKLSRISSVLLLQEIEGQEDTFQRIAIVNNAQYLEDWTRRTRRRIKIQ